MKSCIQWAAFSSAVLPITCAMAQVHPFSVKDDIAMVRFSDPLADRTAPGSEDAQMSPDREHFAILTTKGLLDSDQIESDLCIFDLMEAAAFLKNANEDPPKPRVIATIVSFPHREEPNAYAPVIKDLRWGPDGKSMYFKGESLTGAYQLYEASLDGSEFHALTPETESVGRFDVAKDLIVYTTSRPEEDSAVKRNSINLDAQAITGHSLLDVLFTGRLNTIAPEAFTMSLLRKVNGQWTSKRLPRYSIREIPYLSFLFPFALSPKGEKVIAPNPVSTIPDGWKEYEPASSSGYLRFHGGDPRTTSESLILRPEQYSMIDLSTGAVIPLLNSPNARSLGYSDNNRLAWAPDATRVLVTNTFLPLDQRVGFDRSKGRFPCAVASVDLPSLNARCLLYEVSASNLYDMHVQDVAFGADNDEAVALLKDGLKGSHLNRYRLQDGEWKQTSSRHMNVTTETFTNLNLATGLPKEPLTLRVRQGLNVPPTLWISNDETGQTRQLWNPNPQFSHVRFGDASIYHWKDNTGYEWSGVLIKPVGYVAGNRYPFVIQLYQYSNDEFVTDGLYPTAFAARELASAGFVVLQIGKKPSVLSEADPQDHLEAYRSAVAKLAAAGLIDRSHVGVVGFSWTCWYVINALIKDPNLFAAATIADGIDNSYMQYMLFAVESAPIQHQMDVIRRARPFGHGLRQWIEQAPGFHLDRVLAPVRIEAINPGSVLQEWELYSSLRMQNKPVDLIYFPHGTHIHQKPLERLESQQGDVDWFRFWLQGYEDPDHSKRDQYERWEALKTKRDHDQTVEINK